MLSSLLIPLLLLAARESTASPTPSIAVLAPHADDPIQDAKAPVDTCTTFPAWSISNFTSSASDAVGGGGGGGGSAADPATATFLLTNSLTGTTDEVSCTLQVNYRCIVKGTKSDKNLTVHVAIRAGFVSLILDEEVHDCPGRTTPLHVIGRDDVEIKCTWDAEEVVGGSVQCVQALEEDILQGEAVELAPGPEESR